AVARELPRAVTDVARRGQEERAREMDARGEPPREEQEKEEERRDRQIRQRSQRPVQPQRPAATGSGRRSTGAGRRGGRVRSFSQRPSSRTTGRGLRSRSGSLS